MKDEFENLCNFFANINIFLSNPNGRGSYVNKKISKKM